MRIIILVILVSISTFSIKLHSQQQFQLNGTCFNGGIYDNGTVYRYSPEADTIEVLTHFDDALGGLVSNSSFVEHTPGLLLGCTELGGKNDAGLIFSYDYITNKYNKLFEFEFFTSGYRPNGLLLFGNNGYYYGTTYNGGLYNAGVLFRFDPDNKVFEKLHDFNGSDGKSAYTQLYLSDQNKIYGTTRDGGAELSGVIFEYDICSESFQLLYSFPSSAVNGYIPNGVIMATNGRLYGTTVKGGFADNGVFFEFDLNTGIFTSRGNLNAIQGEKPYGVPTQLENGNIIGTSYNGVIYQFEPSTNAFSAATQFAQENTNKQLSTFIKGPNGNLYCTGLDMGFNGFGSIIEYDPFTQQYDKRHTFSGLLGTSPGFRLFLASNGKMYGFTNSGGSQTNGVIYEFNPSTNTVVKKVDLTAPNEGQTPHGEMILAPDGNYYGTTFQGGTFNKGTIYSIDALSKNFEIIHHFTGNVNGAEPRSGFIFGDDGNLYSMTTTGGSTTNGGVIYKLDLATETVTELFNFGGSNGVQPWGNLMKALDGTFYGLTQYGGQYLNGVVFHFDPVSLNYQVIVHLQSPFLNGKYPIGHITSGNNGKFYSVTTQGGGGGTNHGTIVEIDTLQNTCNVIHSFDNSGFGPGKTIILGSDGNLYGIAEFYGPYFGGVIWKFELSTYSYSILHEFDSINGRTPSGCFFEGPNQILYGTTINGGVNNLGTIYSYDIPNATFTKFFDFNNFSGENPFSTISGVLVDVEINLLNLQDTLCLNSDFTIDFETNGIFSTGNQFIIELSDETGSFVSPVIIGSSVGYNDRFVNATIPNGLVPSDLYRMRVKSTVPPYTGIDNGFNLTIGQDNQPPIPPIISNTTSNCEITCLPIPIAIDNCGQQIEGVTNYSFPISSVGNHQIEWMFIDAAGNQSFAFEMVTIVPDNIAPVPIISILDSIHSFCSIAVVNAPLALDACGLVIEGIPDVSFPISTTGEHNIEWSFTDFSGNVSTQSQIIIIEQMPVVTIDNYDPTLIANISPTEFDLQWINCSNNQIVQSSGSEVFEAPFNGSFSLQFNMDIGCIYNSDCIQIYNSLGLNELNDFSVNLSPNPNSGDFKVQFAQEFKLKDCWLMDMNGRRLKPESIYISGTSIHISMLSIENGIYFLNLECEEGIIQEKVTKCGN